MSNKAKTLTACIMVALGYMIFGTSFFFTGNLLETTPVFDVIALRFLISSLFFVFLRAVGVIKVDFKNKKILMLFLTAIFEPVLYFVFETIGIKYTTTMVAGMIIAFTPVIVVCLETLILKETTSITQKIFLLLGVAGVVLVTLFSKSDGKNTAVGLLCMFLAASSGALFIISSRKSSSSFTPIEISYFSSILGAVVFNAVSIAIHIANGNISAYFEPLYNTENLIGILALAILSTFGATSMINFGISKIQASSVSSFSGISTITTIFVGVVFNGENLMLYHIVSAVMILTGAIGINYMKVKNAERNLSQNSSV